LNTNNKRLIYIDLLKIVAIFSVIIIHVNAMRFYNIDLKSSEWQIYNIFYGITKWCVPVFIMASGMFFLDPLKDISIKKIYTKYIFRLAIALFFWATIYILYRSYIYNIPLDLPIYIKTLLKAQTNYHLWFLYVIIGLYVITPILRKIIESSKRRELEYFLGIWTIFTVLIPFLTSFKTFSPISNLFSQFSISLIGGFVGYFILGYYLKTFEIKKSIRILIYILGFISCIFTIYGTQYLSLRNDALEQKLYGYLSPGVAIMSISVFIFFKYVISKIRFNDITVKIITTLSNCIFGIYLVHDIFIITTLKMQILPNIINPMICVPLFAIGLFLVSFLVSYLINKIPFINKYLV
jgi:surface polysaccharide O-acyltransferase-like enzyme